MIKAISVFKMVLVLAVTLLVAGYVFASSHSEAPGISKRLPHVMILWKGHAE